MFFKIITRFILLKRFEMPADASKFRPSLKGPSEISPLQRHFKTFWRMNLVIVFLLNLSALKAEEHALHPLSISIRPMFFHHLIEQINKRNKPFEMKFCFSNIAVEGQVWSQWSLPQWFSTHDHELVLESTLKEATFQGWITPHCSNNSTSSQKFNIQIENTPFQIWMNPTNLEFKIDHSVLPQLTKNIKINLLESTQISQRLNEEPFKLALLETVISLIEKNISNWFRQRLRGLNFVEPLSSFLKDNPFWNTKEAFQKGSFSFELASNPVLKDIAFTSFPPENQTVWIQRDILQINLNATFFNLNNSKAPTSQTALTEIKKPSAELSPSELSLMIPTTLVNDALTTIYQEGLLRFKTKIHLGQETHGIVTDETPPVFSVISIHSQTAPQITFQADRLRAAISDYYLDIGTEIKDRIIPTTKLSAQASVFGTLHVDNHHQTVNLNLDANTFSFNIKDLKKRLSDYEVKILENLATHLWKNFLTEYSQLILFPTVIETTTLPLEIVAIRMHGDHLLLHLNVHWELTDL